MTRVLRKQKTVNAYNFPYTLNPYIGCPFKCIYCYSKVGFFKMVHGKEGRDFKNLDIAQPNTYKIKGVSKQLPLDELEYDLKNIKPKDEWIREVQIGNNYEPYPPIEKNHKITRQVLELFTKYPDWKIHLETKNNLILRDIDIIKKLPNFEAEITLTTLTHDAYFEPQPTPTTQDRLDLIKILSDEGIFVRVMIMPILNDNINNFTDINQIIDVSLIHGAKDYKTKELNSSYKNLTLQKLINKYNIK